MKTGAYFRLRTVGLVALLLIGTMIWTGCDGGETPPPSTPTIPEAALEEFVVNFYGDSCDSTAPDVLSEGQYKFVLNDVEGTTKPELYISRLTEGHTYQDLLDPQEEPGDYYPKPDWIVYAVKIGYVDPDTGERAYKVTLTPGEHAIYVSNWLPTNEWGLWFCEPLTVVETTSE
jgi:hypothetical protein